MIERRTRGGWAPFVRLRAGRNDMFVGSVQTGGGFAARARQAGQTSLPRRVR